MNACKYNDYGFEPQVTQVRQSNKENMQRPLRPKALEKSNGFNRSNYSTSSRGSQKKGLKLSKKLEPNRESNNSTTMSMNGSSRFIIGRNYGIQQITINTNCSNSEVNRSSRLYQIQKSSSVSSFKIVPTAQAFRNTYQSPSQRNWESPRSVRRCLTFGEKRQSIQLQIYERASKKNQLSEYFKGSIIDDLKGLTIPSLKKV